MELLKILRVCVLINLIVLLSCNTDSGNCLVDSCLEIVFNSCDIISEEDLMTGRKFCFSNGKQLIEMKIGSPVEIGSFHEFHEIKFYSMGTLMDSVFFSINDSFIQSVIFDKDLSIQKSGFSIQMMKINGDNSSCYGDFVHDPCRMGLILRDRKTSNFGHELFCIELKHPNDYHGDQIFCEGVKKIDFWIIDSVKPKIIGLNYKNEFYKIVI